MGSLHDRSAGQTKYAVALIGFRGCGKTTVGRLLAGLLDGSHVDSDAEVERLAGKPLTRIFEEDGEAAFRSFERSAIASICERSPKVIATGGGAILDPLNCDRLRTVAFLVFLDVPEAVLQRRLSRSQGTAARPPLTELPFDQEISLLLAERLPIYRAAADWVLEAGALSPIATARAIAAWFTRVCSKS